MGNAKLNSWMQWILLVGVIATIVISVCAYNAATSIVIPEINVPSANAIAASVLAGVTIPTAEEISNAIVIPDYPEIPESKDTTVSIRDDKDDLAEELATDELDTKDFKRELVDQMNTHPDINIEDYKDIETIVVKDVDVNGLGDTRFVKFELKVSYFNDGDDDEDDLEKSKVEVTLRVTDLDRDDDYEDAEVSDVDDFFVYNFVKVYD